MKKKSEEPAVINVTAKEIKKVQEYLNELLKSENKQESVRLLKLIISIVNTYLSLVQLITKKKTSIKKLKDFIFGSKSEKSKKDDLVNSPQDKKTGGESEGSGSTSGSSTSSVGSTNEDTTESSSKGEDPDLNSDENPDKPRQGGGGRNSQSVYDAMLEIPCLLCVDLQPGQLCPKCGQHKLYNQEPISTVRLVGSAPVEAIRFIQDRSACVCGAKFTAEVPEEYRELFDSPKYTPSALSAMIHLKYDLGVPFGSLAKYQKNSGVPLPASTQSNKINELESVITAVFKSLEKEAANMDCLGMDDTPIKVLQGRETNEGTKTLSGHGTVILCNTLDEGRIAVLYYLDFRHAGQCLFDLLPLRDKNLDGPICICDGAPCYEPYVKKSDVIPGNCNCHSRRKFFPDRNADILCAIIIACYRQIYKNEKHCRENNLSPDQRLAYHVNKSKADLDKLYLVCQFITASPNDEGLDLTRKELGVEAFVTPSEPNSELFTNATYVIQRWEKLTNFIRIPGMPLDTNKVENKIKAIIEIRKKGLFFKTLTSAIYSGKIVSLIESAQANNKNSSQYILFLADHPDEVQKDPEKFLPWNYEQHPLFKLRPPASSHLGSRPFRVDRSSRAPAAPSDSSLQLH